MHDMPIIRAQASPWRHGVELFIGNREARTRVSKIEIEQMKPDEAVAYEPSFVLGNTAAQALMDDLWHCGLRPTEGTGSAGALAAVQRHLEDMRTLVFKNNSNA